MLVMLCVLLILCALKSASAQGKDNKPYSPAVYSFRANTYNIKNHICEAFNCEIYPSASYKYEGATAIDAKDGLLVTKCGVRDFLFSKLKIMCPTAWKTCCALGMEVGSIHNAKHLDCLQTAFDSTDIFGAKQKFSLNLFDHFLNRTFLTCPDKRAMSPDLWLPGEPNNMMKIEACTALVLTKSRKMSGLEDVNGMTPFFAFCQTKTPVRQLDGIKQSAVPSTTKDTQAVPPPARKVEEVKKKSGDTQQKLKCMREQDYAQIVTKMQSMLNILSARDKQVKNS